MAQSSGRITFVGLVGTISGRKQTIHSLCLGGGKQFMAFPEVVLAEGDAASVMLYRTAATANSVATPGMLRSTMLGDKPEYEYGEALGPWSHVPQGVDDAHQYAIAFARKSRGA